MEHSNAWHTMDAEEISVRLETNAASGLTRKQAIKRRRTLQVRRPEAMRALFLPVTRPLYTYIGKMFLDPIIMLALFIAMVAIIFEQYLLGGAVAVLTVINCVGCGIAHMKARSISEHLQLYSNPMVKVIREGQLFTADARRIVPGDVVLLTPGDVCPADVRLQKGSAVTVTQYVHTGDQRELLTKRAQKNGDVTYLASYEIHNPDYENIVYAGSIIEQGSARGIVVETGAYTYVGAIRGTVPGADVTTDPESITYLKKFCIRFTTLQAILLLPLTIVLSITMNGTLSIAECFLTALALSLTCVAEHVVALGRMIVSAGVYSAAQPRENDATAIVKSSLASDRLCDMTDLFLLDSSAISDGKYHLESVYAGGSIYTDREFADKNNRDVCALAGDLYLYRSATRPIDAQHSESFDSVFSAPIDALIKYIGVDTTALGWNRLNSRVEYRDNSCIAHNDMKQGGYQVVVSQSEDLLCDCTLMQSNDTTVAFDDSNHIALRTLCRIYRESGYLILLVAHREQDCTTLMGVLAFSQRVGSGFSDCCGEMIDSGVRLSVFMENTPESMKILADSGIVRDENNDVLTADRAGIDGLELPVAYGSYRAYLGFSDPQIAELIETLKKRGARIASYCVDNSKQELHSMADLTITCDALEYRSVKVAESLYGKMPVDGKPFSTRASQNTRRRSDVILRRACAKGGGLHGILTGRLYAFAVNHNLANMMTYLLTVQIFRTVLIAVCALFAIPTLTPVSILIGGLVLDAVAALLFAFSIPDKQAITSSYPIMRRLEKPLTYNTANVVSACVSALMLWLFVVVLQITGVIETAWQSMALAFASTYLLQGVIFLVTWREYTKGNKQKRFSGIRAAVAIGYVLLLLACLWLPGLNDLTAGANLTWLTALLAPIISAIYYLLYRLLSWRGLNLHK